MENAEPNATNQQSQMDTDGAVLKDKLNPEVLQNIPVTISVEVGRAEFKIRDLVELAQGSVIQLDRAAGEPLDLLVNNTLVAKGEVVVIGERYGIKLTSVVPTADRLKNL
jgi:flagellar motor switch protein FliN/FliY